MPLFLKTATLSANSKMSQQVKKMKQGMSYSCKEKTIILNVFKYFRIEFPDKCVTEIVRRTSKATGCSEKSIFQFRKEEASAEGFKEPSKTKVRKSININSRDIKYDSNVRQSIRNIIYDLKYKNVVTSLSAILRQVNGDERLPNFSLMTLRRLLSDMGFYYEKNGNKSVLVEKAGVVNKDNLPQKKEAKAKKSKAKPKVGVQNSVGYTEKPVSHYQPVPQNGCVPVTQYPSQSHFLVPMHLSHNDPHMMGPLHPDDNKASMMARMLPPPHIEAPWMHVQHQPPLPISSN